ncbi:FAD-dependent thymidylate synthase [Staphylococcus equorum]|uniref:FAD-dependent thymidylate synthase n=1 Tax=Staphylococcus equorum TaxID=246432 RepID=UPI00192D198B|nr:FAD-dependent thymidylate synthase [Staphylococcus equorum]
MINEKAEVLNNGYVRLVDVMGSDLNVVNAARVSYDKEASELTDKDIGLLKFLAREGHTSPFRHAFATFEVYAPLIVARQWWKYIAGSDHAMDSWNESSRRYITEEPTFYVPKENEWRSKPANSKQGSGSNIENAIGVTLTEGLLEHIESSERLYNDAMEIGVAPEQARLFLPAYSMNARWRWSASLQSITHFLNQRLEHDSQYEIQQFAKAVLELIRPYFEHSIDNLVKTEEY